MKHLVLVCAFAAALTGRCVEEAKAEPFVICINNVNKKCSVQKKCSSPYYRHDKYENEDRLTLCRKISAGSFPNLKTLCDAGNLENCGHSD
jgi:hypothetical protein